MKKSIAKTGERKNRFCWNPGRDIRLINKVLEHRPFEYGKSVLTNILSELKQECSYDVTERSCLLRTDHLMRMYKSADMASLKTSGTEEEFTSRDKLLEEIKGLMEVEEFLPSTEDEELGQSVDLASIGMIVGPAQPNYNEAASIDAVGILTNSETYQAMSSSTSFQPQSSSSSKEIGCIETTGSAQGKLTVASSKSRKLGDKIIGDQIRKEALDNSLNANIAEEPNKKRSKRAIDFGEFLTQKLKAEERDFQLKELEVKHQVESKRVLDEKRLEMEERLEMKKLELEFEDKQKQREEHERERDHQERMAEQDHQRKLEFVRERQAQDDKFFKMMEFIMKK